MYSNGKHMLKSERAEKVKLTIERGKKCERGGKSKRGKKVKGVEKVKLRYGNITVIKLQLKSKCYPIFP